MNDVINLKESKLKEEIHDYNQNIDQYRQALQTQSVWLFLAILGCWSVTSGTHIQLFAFVITFIFFILRVVSHLGEKKSFNSFEKDISKLIEAEFIAGQKKEFYLSELTDLKNKRNSSIQAIKVAPMFIVCLAFYVISFYDQVWCLFYS